MKQSRQISLGDNRHKKERKRKKPTPSEDEDEARVLFLSSHFAPSHVRLLTLDNYLISHMAWAPAEGEEKPEKPFRGCFTSQSRDIIAIAFVS